MDHRDELIAERDSLAAELETLRVALRVGKKGRFLRLIALTYGTGGREAFEIERTCHTLQGQVERMRSQKRAVEHTLLSLRRP